MDFPVGTLATKAFEAKLRQECIPTVEPFFSLFPPTPDTRTEAEKETDTVKLWVRNNYEFTITVGEFEEIADEHYREW